MKKKSSAEKRKSQQLENTEINSPSLLVIFYDVGRVFLHHVEKYILFVFVVCALYKYKGMNVRCTYVLYSIVVDFIQYYMQ